MLLFLSLLTAPGMCQSYIRTLYHLYAVLLLLLLLLLLLGDVADQRFRLLRSMFQFCDLFICLSVRLYVCHVRACAQTADDIVTISFAYVSHVSLPDRIKTWLSSVNSLIPKFCDKVNHPRLI